MARHLSLGASLTALAGGLEVLSGEERRWWKRRRLHRLAEDVGAVANLLHTAPPEDLYRRGLKPRLRDFDRRAAVSPPTVIPSRLHIDAEAVADAVRRHERGD